MTIYTHCKMGDVVSLEQGLAINKKSKHLVVQSGLPLLRITDMLNQNFNQFIDEEKVPQKFIARDNDLIFTRTGQVGYVFRQQFGVIHNNCFRINPIESVDRGFMYWYLKQDKVRKHANMLAKGAAQPDLNHNAFKSLDFSFPSDIEDQKKIVDILNQYEELIENNKRRIELLEEAARQLYKEWFVRFRFPGHEHVKIIDGVPEGWEKVTFGDSPLQIIDGDRGKNYPKQGEFSDAEHCLFLNAKNVTKSGFKFSECQFITEAKDNLLRKGKLSRGDVIMTTRGTIGNVAYYNKNILYDHIRINSGMVIFRTFEEQLPPSFLYQYLRSEEFNTLVHSLRSGAAQPQLPIRDIKLIKIILPTGQILDQFNETCQVNHALISKLDYQNQQLFKARDLLLPKLMNGEIIV